MYKQIPQECRKALEIEIEEKKVTKCHVFRCDISFLKLIIPKVNGGENPRSYACCVRVPQKKTSEEVLFKWWVWRDSNPRPID